MIKTQEETEMKLELKKKLNNAQEEESPPPDPDPAQQKSDWEDSKTRSSLIISFTQKVPIKESRYKKSQKMCQWNVQKHKK